MILFRFLRPVFVLLGAAVLPLQAAIPALLDEAVQKWTAEKADWAFTQRVRTYSDDGLVTEKRLERYDPSLPDDRRWHLLTFNGKDPTEEQQDRWETRRNRRPRKRTNKPPGEYFDFEHAVLSAETAQTIRYDVPVRPEAARLIQVEKLIIGVTVNKETRTIEHVSAALREPMKVALGLAKITDLDLDVRFDSNAEKSPSSPASGQPTGSAQATVSKLGNRADYAWSDFKRVTTYAPANEKTGANTPSPAPTAKGETDSPPPRLSSNS